MGFDLDNIVIPFDLDRYAKLQPYQKEKLCAIHNPWALSQLNNDAVEMYDYTDLPGYGFTGKVEFRESLEFNFNKGHEAWYKNGLLHREDGPAVYYGHAHYWYLCGRQHCATGPAFISDSGIKEWFLFGKKVSAEDVFQQLTPEQKEKAIWNLDEWR